MTSFCWQAAAEALQRVRPAATPRERDNWLLQERYGHDLANRVMALRQTRHHAQETGMTSNRMLWEALLPVIDALTVLHVPYYVGGSVASSVTGVARASGCRPRGRSAE